MTWYIYFAISKKNFSLSHLFDNTRTLLYIHRGSEQKQLCLCSLWKTLPHLSFKWTQPKIPFLHLCSSHFYGNQFVSQFLKFEMYWRWYGQHTESFQPTSLTFIAESPCSCSGGTPLVDTEPSDPVIKETKVAGGSERAHNVDTGGGVVFWTPTSTTEDEHTWGV